MSSTGNNTPVPGEERPSGFTLRDALYIVFRHKWTISIIFVLCSLAGLVVALLMPDVYLSEAEVIVSVPAWRSSKTLTTCT